MTRKSPLLATASFRKRLVALCASGNGSGIPRSANDRDVILVSVVVALPDHDLDRASMDDLLDRWIERVGVDLGTDRAALRRALVDWKFVARTQDGSCYRKADPLPVEIAPDILALDMPALIREAQAEREARRLRFAPDAR